jgi:ATP-binding cassette, subfamily B, bacterial
MVFPFVHQTANTDCGPTCLKMVADFYGREYTTEYLTGKCNVTKAGVSLLEIGEAAKTIGFHCTGVKMNLSILKLVLESGPVILHWRKIHFVVLYGSSKGGRFKKYFVADPAIGLVEYYERELEKYWIRQSKKSFPGASYLKHASAIKADGYALLLKPTVLFYSGGNTNRRYIGNP